MALPLNRSRAAELVGKSALAALFTFFAYAHYSAFAVTQRASIVFAVVTEALLVAMIVLRRPAADVSFTPSAWITSLGGTLTPLLLRPVQAASDTFAGDAVQALGTLIAIGGILSLNRSIGLLPAHRGIQQSGMYRLVRHPLYSAYTITGLGYLMNHPNLRNASLVAAGFGFQLFRLVNEERFLSRDPEYVAYKQRTRWRLVPFVY